MNAPRQGVVRSRALFPAAALGLLFAACEQASGPGGSGPGAPALAVARIRSVPPEGAGDTVVATFRYDANGMLVREVENGLFNVIREYDALGRYVRRTQHHHRDTSEVSVWVAPDSSVRGSAHSTLQVRERWFGLRPNCRCADSMYRYSFDGTLHHVRRWTFDDAGSIVLVTRDFADPARRDTAQRYENVYLQPHLHTGSTRPRLMSRLAYDFEAEEIRRQVFEHAPLDSLLEAR